MMRPECSKYTGRLQEICNGCAGLPPYKINAYRARWGLEPLKDEDVIYAQPITVERPAQERPSRVPKARPAVTRAHPKSAQPRKSGGCCGGKRARKSTYKIPEIVQPSLQPDGHGPGSQLLKLWEGMPHCDACTELAAIMDSWGPEKCTEKFGEIVVDILPRAQAWIRDNHPVMQKVLKFTSTEQFALTSAIAMSVRRAIKLARLPSQ